MLFKDWDVVLTGDHIRITPMRAEDEKAYSKLFYGYDVDEILQTLGHLPATGIESVLNHTEDAETHALRLLDNDEFIGWIVLQKDPEGRPDVGISLVEEYRDQGIGPEAVAMFVNRLHSEYGIERVYLRISDFNIQSQKAFAKLGAVLYKQESDNRMKRILDILQSGKVEEEPVPELLYFYLDLPVTVDEGVDYQEEYRRQTGKDLQTGDIGVQ